MKASYQPPAPEFSIPFNQIDATPPLLVSTGLERLDRLLGGGMATGHVTGVIGLPESGRTSLAIELASAAEEAGRPVLHVACNTNAAEILARYAARLFAPSCERSEASYKVASWREVFLGQQPIITRFTRCLRIHVIDAIAAAAAPSAMLAIATAATALKFRHNQAPLIVNDQLEHLGWGPRRALRCLRTLAQALDAPVVIVATRGDTYAERPAAVALRECASNLVEMAAIDSHVAGDRTLLVTKSLLGNGGASLATFDPATGRWAERAAAV
jgi:hypothetical protein